MTQKKMNGIMNKRDQIIPLPPPKRVMDEEQTFKSSRIRTLNCRSCLANTFHVDKFNVGR